mgnify:CR=1 FL=1
MAQTQTQTKKSLVVSREKYTTKDGHEGFSYFVPCKVRGKDIQARVEPTDFGGYELLDLIFDIDKDKAKLSYTDNEIKDEKTGEIRHFKSFEVSNSDELGEVKCPIKPSRPSDRAIIELALL